MIHVKSGNITLSLISHRDVEQMCIWRNLEHVKTQMRFKEIITLNQQKIWFESLNQQMNLYFKIVINNESIGIVNLKDIDWKERKAEAGVFIGETNFLETATPITSVLVMMRFAFESLAMNCLYATVSRFNTNAIKFNLALGYKLIESREDEFDYYSCSLESFESSDVSNKLSSSSNIEVQIDKGSEWILSYCNTSSKGFHFG